MISYTIITPTGDRPEAFHLCSEYVKRQTVNPTQWIVVDDGMDALDLSALNLPYLCYIRRQRSQYDPSHTLPVQILAALQRVNTDYVVIMEDDDWYSPFYCERMLNKLIEGKGYFLVGQGETIYYHLSGRYMINKNQQHASFCQTAFRSSILNRIESACNRCYRSPFLDLEIWKSKVAKNIFTGEPLCIGIKGMPGREGTTKGWDKKYPRYSKDKNFQFLEKYIGSDVLQYKKIAETCYESSFAK